MHPLTRVATAITRIAFLDFKVFMRESPFFYSSGFNGFSPSTRLYPGLPFPWPSCSFSWPLLSPLSLGESGACVGGRSGDGSTFSLPCVCGLCWPTYGALGLSCGGAGLPEGENSRGDAGLDRSTGAKDDFSLPLGSLFGCGLDTSGGGGAGCSPPLGSPCLPCERAGGSGVWRTASSMGTGLNFLPVDFWTMSNPGPSLTTTFRGPAPSMVRVSRLMLLMTVVRLRTVVLFTITVLGRTGP